MFGKMVFSARMVLGIFYLISGFNWFFGFLPMLPHIGMPADLPMKHVVVSEMIKTGWMFQTAKVIEIFFGLSMLTNRAVPLMLAATLPVAFITFMLDALILDDIWRWMTGVDTTAQLLIAIEDMVIGGLCVLLPHLWLMVCYFGYYRPACAWRTEPSDPCGADALRGSPSPAQTAPHAPACGLLRKAFLAFGGFAILLQAYNLYLISGMIQ